MFDGTMDYSFSVILLAATAFCRCSGLCRGNRERHNQSTDREEIEGNGKWNACELRYMWLQFNEGRHLLSYRSAVATLIVQL